MVDYAGKGAEVSKAAVMEKVHQAADYLFENDSAPQGEKIS